MHAVQGPFTATPREPGPPSTARTVHGALPVKQRMPACSREPTWGLCCRSTPVRGEALRSHRGEEIVGARDVRPCEGLTPIWPHSEARVIHRCPPSPQLAGSALIVFCSMPSEQNGRSVN